MKNPLFSSAATVSRTTHLTQLVPSQPGTIRREGNPWMGGIGSEPIAGPMQQARQIATTRTVVVQVFVVQVLPAGDRILIKSRRMRGVSIFQALWRLLKPSPFWFAATLVLGTLSSLSEGVGITLFIPILNSVQTAGGASVLPRSITTLFPRAPFHACLEWGEWLCIPMGRPSCIEDDYVSSILTDA